MRRFELALPRSIKTCLTTLAQRGADAKLVAGGTDLLPQLKNGLLKPAFVVDLSGVPPLRRLKADRQELRVGAAVTAREIELDPAGARGLSGPRRERRPRGLGADSQPRHRGRQSVQRGALRGHGAPAPGPRRRGRDRRAAGSSAASRWRPSSWASGAPCSLTTSCWSSWSCPPRERAAAELPPPHPAARAGHRRGRGGLAAHALQRRVRQGPHRARRRRARRPCARPPRSRRWKASRSRPSRSSARRSWPSAPLTPSAISGAPRTSGATWSAF